MPDHSEYRTSEELGMGGFATVFRATKRGSTQELALKVTKSVEENPDAHARMKREIDVQSRIISPHVMEILDSGEDGDWFTMPLAVGDLEKLAQNGTVKNTDLTTIESVIRQIAKGLEAAHELRCLHRDVKPRNILYIAGTSVAEEGRWVVADWGLVKRPPGETTTMRTQHGGDRLGTPGYAAPELFHLASNATVTADVYSLGRVALRLISGEQPLEAEAPDGPWGTWIRECTQHDPSRRPRSMQAAVNRLDSLLHPPTRPAAALRERLAAEEPHVSDETWDLILDNGLSRSIYRALAKSSLGAARDFGRNRPDDAFRLCDDWLSEIDLDFLDGGFGRYNTAIIWILHAAKGISASHNYAHLEALLTKLFAIDFKYNQYDTQGVIIEWLRTVSEPVDTYVVNALRAADVGSWYARSGRTMSSDILQDEFDDWS